jgi:hypothetical protein
MSDITTLRASIQKAKTEIQSSLISEGNVIGADTAALIEDRIVSKGEKAEGGKFSPYSTKPVPAFLYFGRSRNAGGEAAVKRASKEKRGISYKDFRQFNGLNTSFKNFQFSGEMWSGFGVRTVRLVSSTVVEIEIGGKNSRSNLLFKAHSERENSELTAPSEKELKIISETVQERIINILKRNL